MSSRWKAKLERADRNLVASCCLVCAVLVLHVAHYWPYLCDDTLISLRYAQRLVQGLGLTWSEGIRVEGYSNLLWVLLNAGLGALGANLIWAARTLAFVGAVVGVGGVCLSVTTARPDPRRALVGGLALVLSAPVAVWIPGGMEHPLMLGVLVLVLLLGERALESRRPSFSLLLAISTLLGALALFRHDGALLTVAAAIGAIATRPDREGLRIVSVWSCVPIAAVLAQAAFRQLAYGTWLPHTAVVKVAFNWERLREGALYAWHGSHAFAVLIGLSLTAVLLLARRVPPGRIVLPVAVACTWSAYVVVAGGDIFPGWRQWLILLAPLSMLLAEGAEQIPALLPRVAYWGRYALPPLAVLHLAWQTKDSENQRVLRESWVWDAKGTAILLRSAFAHKNPLLAVDAAGGLPYWSELDSLDMLGLNDPFMIRNRPQSFGRGPTGHELGDGDYVWRRRPDIVVFGNARGYPSPMYRSGRELMAHRDFASTYQLVRMKAPLGSSAPILAYIRRSDGPLGATSNADLIRIPGYFLASPSSKNTAELDVDGNLVTPVSRTRPGVIRQIPIAAGTWRVFTVPPVSVDGLQVRCPHRASTRGTVIRVSEPLRVDLIAAPTREAAIREVRWERVKDNLAAFECN